MQRGRGRSSGTPAFSGRGGGGGRTSLGPRDGAVGRGGRGRGRGRRPLNSGNYMGNRGAAGGTSLADARAQEIADADNHELEAGLGFPLFTEGEDRLGWLININTTTLQNRETNHVVSAINCYFISQDGSMFKAQLEFSPYFYLQVKDDMEREVDAYVRRKFEAAIKEVEVVYMEDLDLKNHLSGLKRKLLKVSFRTDQQLSEVKRELGSIVRRNARKSAAAEAYDAFAVQQRANSVNLRDALDAIVGLREADVLVHHRFCIDRDVRCGQWYTVSAKEGSISIERRADLLKRAEPRICAFDIETTKLPLQFPNAEYDQVFMISYMIDKVGYLIVNREVVGEDIHNFEYTPKPEFDGPFTVWNEPDEAATLRRWFNHMREVKPAIYVTYNGDFFDWPFIETRAAKHDLDMHEQIGFRMNRKTNECLSKFAVHMDCLAWVNRDSYLPQGSRGLKAVTKEKLNYNPIEVDPEDMVRFAAEQPQTMAAYSVSDAVATYYLYMAFIHPFIFSLSTVIPMAPDEVLRKGSGTLCEALLMVEAHKANVVAPNKHASATETMYKGHLLESETYIGGKVEALESGVFRSDLPIRFKCKASAYQELIDTLDNDLKYAIEVEGGMQMSDAANFEEVRDSIKEQLEDLRDTPTREEPPLIYHLDVAAMYPNIILTNRLQPSAIVTDEDCAACDSNQPGKKCLRKMTWVWRGETYAATSSEYHGIKNQLASELQPPEQEGGPPHSFDQLPFEERDKLLKDRLKKYCQKVYKRVLDKPVHETREAGICMKENDFYVGTVRAFRDRRYEYKGLNKLWKGKLEAAKAAGNPIDQQTASDMVVLYDSLQLAHKCILNSFYGYVMRRGARWYSMEMAGVVTNTGAEIIQRAARLVEQLGLPLELDTDGIWCVLPASFPETYQVRSLSKGKGVKLSYPCVMLNVIVAKHYTNDQYQELVDPVNKVYKTSSQMSIEFEVDGPYKAMILPASKEEGKLIKKRYAVFNMDGSLAELKGFEIKRRGELKLLKVFQSEVFEQFLEGETLEECYKAVAAVANRWLDLLDTQGVDVTDDELLTYISESNMMSKALEEYEDRKSCAITTAKRLGQFLGDERIKDKGLVCNYVIARRPENLPTSERAIPVAIFSTSPAVQRSFLRKWCGEVGGGDTDEKPDFRDIVDWDYYRERLGSAIQKIITIPAAMQHIPNPVPRVQHPEWLRKKVREKDDRFQQRRLDAFFKTATKGAGGERVPMDVEDMGEGDEARPVAGAHARAAVGRMDSEDQENVGDHANVGASGGGEDLGSRPSRREDPAGWLAYQKRTWRAAAQARKKRKAAAERNRKRQRFEEHAGDEPETDLRGAGVGAFFRQQQAEAAASHWQLIQLAPTNQPGTFKAWALIGNKLYSVPLTVARTFYLNSTLPPDAPEASGFGERVKRILPNGERAYYVYKVVMDDGEFRSSAAEVALSLARGHVKGVHEERLPLQLQALLTAGCVTSLVPAARSRAISEGFTLTDLQMRTTAQCSYLEGEGPDGLGALRQIQLYRSCDAGGRAVWALYLPPESRLLLVVVSPASGRAAREVSATAAERQWKEAQAQRHPDESDQVAATVNVAYASSHVDALKAVNTALSRFRETHRGPVVLLVESPGGGAKLARELSMLAEFPFADAAAHSIDCAYPSIGWQPRAVRTAVFRIVQGSGHLKVQAEIARYCQVPLSHLGADWVLDAADAMYARFLREAGHLLWISDPSLPDVASKGDDSSIPGELLGQSEITMERLEPGAYRTVCVKVEIPHLAVTAVEQAGLVGELEGTMSADDAAACAPAFKVLRALVHKWMADARLNDWRADRLLRYLWRWLCSPNSALGSPALIRTVASLMRKCLAHLVSEIRRLGATVVAANSNSIILATGKRSLSEAVGYVDYLLAALRGRELFTFLVCKPRTFWHTLLFRDRYNYLGIEAAVPEVVMQNLLNNPGALNQAVPLYDLPSDLDEVGQDLKYDAQWNLKDYLPPATHEVFLTMVGQFVVLPWRHAGQLAATAGAQVGSQAAAADSKSSQDAQTEWLLKNMQPHFLRKLLHIVGQIEKQVLPTSDDPSHAFPRLAGSHLSEEELGSPALAFTRAICEILALDTALEEEVAIVRRNLLRLIHVREFSPAAAFKEPCRSYVLRDVICSFCSACCDLDLCRDTSLQAHEWACAECHHERDKDAIEAQLMAVVGRRNKAYQLQDLRCSKCRQIAGAELSLCCKFCGGSLVNTQTAEDMRAGLTTFQNVAKYHNFQLLLETTEWLLRPLQ